MATAEDGIADAPRLADPEKRLECLFGTGVDWARATGVLHVTAIGARRVAIDVGSGGPKSPTDRFVLGFARARADVIVTTGAILRAEPGLIHRAADLSDEEDAWTRWRAGVLGRRTPPTLLVLTASGEIDLDHPALAACPHAVVWTTAAGRARLGSAGRRIDVVVDGGSSALSARGDALAALSAATRWLRGARGAETVVLEAGPHSTQGLYALDPTGERSVVAVDELLLSVYAGGAFPAVAGPELPESERLAAYFASGAPRTRARVDDASGSWIFERYRRA